VTPAKPDPIVCRQENLEFSNKYIAVYDDAVTTADGSPGTYLRIVESEGRPGVAMLPVAAGRIGLVKTFRYPLAEWEWSIPRGFGDYDDPLISARSELAEELGLAPDELVQLGTVAPNSGLLSAKVRLFLALYSKPPSTPLDADEIHAVRWLTVEDLREEIGTGQIIDSFTLSALAIAMLTGKLDHLTL
jgi:ADP-ribose pyrophosphatase